MTLFEYAIARCAEQLRKAQEHRKLTEREACLLDTILEPALQRYEAQEMAKKRGSAGVKGAGR